MASKAMMFVDAGNRILEDIIRSRVDVDPDTKLDPVHDRLSDFDDVSFAVAIENATPTIITVSMYMPCFGQVEACGARDFIAEAYGEMVVEPIDGADVSLVFDTTAPPAGVAAADLPRMVSLLRRHALGAPLTRAFRALVAGTSGELPASQITYHKSESLFVIPRPDHVVVIFMLEFDDVTDRAMARVIASELVEAQRHVNAAPPVSFSRDAPLEMSGLDLTPSPSFVGFVSFKIAAVHVNSPAKLESAVTHLHGFRNYLHYHIKAAKTYIHMRMRDRGTKMLQVLNRAIPEDPFASKEKKLISGKTFTRKPVQPPPVPSGMLRR